MAILSTILLLLSGVPLLATRYPPLIDYPNHAMRMYLLHHWEQMVWFHQFYWINNSPLPDLALDLVVLPLAGFMPVAAAMRIMMFLLMILPPLGIMLVRRALHLQSPVPVLLGILILYNGILLYGFINYLFGIGVAVLGLAAWIALRKQPLWQRLGAGSAMALLVYFCHLAAFGIYAVTIAAFELDRLWPNRGRPLAATARGLVLAGLPAGLTFVAPLLLLVFGIPATDGPAELSIPTPLHKLAHIPQVLITGNPALDAASAAVLLILLGWLVVRRQLGFGPARLALTVGGAILVLYFVLPEAVGGGYYLDVRVFVGGCFVILAVLPLQFASSRAERVTAGVVAALIVVRIAVLTLDWSAFDRRYEQFATALDAVPQHSVIVAAAIGPKKPPLVPVWYEGMRPPTRFAALYAIERRQSYMPFLFADPRQHRLAYHPQFKPLYELQDRTYHTEPDRAALTATVEGFRRTIAASGIGDTIDAPGGVYLLLDHIDAYHDDLPPGLAPVFRGEDFLIARLDGGT